MTDHDTDQTTDQPSPSIAVETAFNAIQKPVNALIAQLREITPIDSPAAALLDELFVTYADACNQQIAALEAVTGLLADIAAFPNAPHVAPLTSMVYSFARFAAELQGIREMLGLTPSGLAEYTLTLDAQTITGIESGTHVPTFSQMVELLNATGCGFIIVRVKPTE